MPVKHLLLCPFLFIRLLHVAVLTVARPVRCAEIVGNSIDARSQPTDSQARHQVVIPSMAFSSAGRLVSYDVYAGVPGDGAIQVGHP